MKRRGQKRTAGQKHERAGADVLHLAHYENKFADSDVGSIQ